MANVVESYVAENSEKEVLPVVSRDEEEQENKRESLAILASLGETKEYLGVNLSLGDVKKLTGKKVQVYYCRYEAVLGKQVAGALVRNGINMFCHLASYLLPIDDVDALSSDLTNDEILKRELTSLAGFLVLRGGRGVAIASAMFQVASHLQLGDAKDYMRPPSTPTDEPTGHHTRVFGGD